MLVDLHHAEKLVTRHPHADHMRLIRQRAGDRYLAMMEALNLKIHDKQVATSSWMPPPGDWLDTPLQTAKLGIYQIGHSLCLIAASKASCAVAYRPT